MADRNVRRSVCRTRILLLCVFVCTVRDLLAPEQHPWRERRLQVLLGNFPVLHDGVAQDPVPVL